MTLEPQPSVSLLVTDTLTWKDIAQDDAAWETLVWFSTIVMMASQLSHGGMSEWFSQWMTVKVSGLDWHLGGAILALAYFYSHYLFASNLAHVSAMFSPFFIVAISMGTPPALAFFILAAFSSLFGCLTQYGCGPAAILYGAGYVPVGTWWRLGSIFSVIYIVIFMTIGAVWWHLLGLW